MDSKTGDRIEDALSNHEALERLAERVQQASREFDSHLPEGLLSLLHGEPLGHPLHPILINLPLGGWVISGILDFLPSARQAENERAADLSLLIGTVGAAAALSAGWADWSNTRGEARRTGLIHGTVNTTAFLLNSASLLARKRGKRGLGKALSGTALALAAAGGFLGGQLVYRHGLGVGHTLSVPQG